MRPSVRKRFCVFLQSNITDTHLLIGGLITVAGFLLQRDPYLKLTLSFVFMTLVYLGNKRIRLAPPLVILVSVTAMNLLRPYGSLLFSVGPLDITAGALKIGIVKASTLAGLIYVSRLFVRPTVTLPGRGGALLGNTLYFFDIITEEWKQTKGSSPINRIDNLLLRMETEISTSETGGCADTAHPSSTSQTKQTEYSHTSEAPDRTTPAGFLFLATIPIAVWILFALSL